jgi:hypothetical protein
MKCFGSAGRSRTSLWVLAALWTGCAAAAPATPGDDDSNGQGGTGAQGGSGPANGGTGAAANGGTSSGTAGSSGNNAKGGGTAAGGTSGATTNASGGVANTSGTATGGTMAMTMCGTAVGAASDKNIDDLEDADNTIGNGMGAPMPPSRVGYWFTYNETTDGSNTCKQSPPPDPSGLLPFPPEASPGNGSAFGAHTHGTGCNSDWGAGLGVDFNNCNGKSNAYDGSAYTGITFWYKSTTKLRVLVSTLPNLPTAEGGTCTSDCNNHHGKNFAAAPSGTTATITWAELKGTAQIGNPPANPQTFGTMRAFDPKQLLNLEVQVDGFNGASDGASFDFWIDNLAFL